MKYFRYLSILLLLLLCGTSSLFSQNLTQTTPLFCKGDQAGFVIDQNYINTISAGRTVAKYRFYYGNGAFGDETNKNNNYYVFSPAVSAVGNWTASATIYFTNGDSVAVGTLPFTVYNKPIADFQLDPNSRDTQCFSAGTNSFCFINKSKQDPSAPSNPIASCFWTWGDGETSTDCGTNICHSFQLSGTFSVRLKVTDTKGCFSDIVNPPGPGGIPKGITVIKNVIPDFKWAPLPPPLGGPCFKSCYKFTNLSAATISQIQYYKWDFKDYQGSPVNICSPLEPDSFQYSAFTPFTKKDPVKKIFDSAYFDTIVHCYCTNGQFTPSLTIQNNFGCIDSVVKTTDNSSTPLPYNIQFKFNIITSKEDLTTPKSSNVKNADSVCAGNLNTSKICFKQDTISFLSAGSGDFIWDFGDPGDPNLKNIDSTTWTPCHVYSGMGSFFPSLKVKNKCPDTTFFYYAATMVGPQRRYIDTIMDLQNDLFDTRVSTSRIDNNAVLYPSPLLSPAFDGQAMVLNVVDSVQMVYVRTETGGPKPLYVYKMIPKLKYYGDSLYKLLDTTFVYSYYDSVPAPTYFRVPNPPFDPGQLYNSIKDSLSVPRDTVYTMYVRNKLGNIKDTLWYVFSRTYNYGVRVLGPVAQIEKPPAGITIKGSQKNQCGPRDTVDFVNASMTGVGFKSRNVWRRWDFDDDYAPQCTSYSVPHKGWPKFTSIDSIAYYEPITNKRVVMRDTTWAWRDAVEQYNNSDHYFISNGKNYPGKRNCKFSHDTLPRHHYQDWDTVYLWYRYGHDFMPWDTTRWSTDGSKQFNVKPWDLKWWGKPIYLNVATGGWSLTQDSSFTTSYIDSVPYVDPITLLPGFKKIIKDTLPGIWTKWPRIDTMNTNNQPQDITPGNSTQGGIKVTNLPDPYEMVKGNYYLISALIDTAVHTPTPLSYVTPQGQTVILPSGLTLIPGGSKTFFEYAFRRTIQKCYTVRLRLSDSLNNESVDTAGMEPNPLDITRLDMWDCSSEATVQLALGKPDAQGMGKKGKECPGKNPTGYPALTFNTQSPYPGMQLTCGGRTAIWINIDSLADRQDATPCYLDAFTTWGVGTPGTKINPGPGVNVTPGGLTRNTFYTGMNWNPLPPSPWTGASGTLLQYHMGGNAGTPPPADDILGQVTIGIFIGNGQLDTTIQVSAAAYNANPSAYQNLVIKRTVRNLSTPPPSPIPPTWKDDSITYSFKFNQILGSKSGSTYTLEYLEENWPKCLSDTVWYHNFWTIKQLDPTFFKSPADFATLRERSDSLMVIYRDSTQDSMNVAVWTWGDGTATVDSFYRAEGGATPTDGYYVNGLRRVRYNIDYRTVLSGEIMDSIVWPCGVYGQRQFNEPIRFYKRIFDSIGYIAADSLLILRSKCSVKAHDDTGKYPSTIRIPIQDTVNLPANYRRIFDSIGFESATSTLLLVNKCPNPTHYDASKYPYSNYFDTVYLPIRDTSIYTQYKLVDTSLMMLPVKHKYNETSWELGAFARKPGASNTQVSLYIENTKHCSYSIGNLVTIGVIDTLHIYDGSGKEDTVFCKNEPVYFVDSVRYFRYDNQAALTDRLLNPGRSRNNVYTNFPFDSYKFDTTDFWARDVNNPSDTLSNSGNLDSLTKFLVEFKYYPGQWTHFDEFGNYYKDTTGHWNLVLRGGDVPVVFPKTAVDPANLNPQIGTIIFYPGANYVGFGPSGLYTWDASAKWVQIPTLMPLQASLSSLTDISLTPSPQVGRTLVYNDGKGTLKRVGMYYWNGASWTFIANSKYTTFPYLTHRLYWDFGDGSPLYVGTRPVHKYNADGRYKVTMVSRDSVGAFDTCISFIQILKPVAKPYLLNRYIGCNDTASFRDSSVVLGGTGEISTIDHITNIYWWFNLRYAYPNGLQGQDTLSVQSVTKNPTWFYSQKGVFKIKLAILTEQGCVDTASDSLTIEGPRPAFKLISDTVGCKPYRIALLNLADSFGMRAPSDTPTRATIFYWGDGQRTAVYGRRDTVYHTYADTGTYNIVAAGRDAAEFSPTTCPIVYSPDTVAGFQYPVTVIVNNPYHAEIISSMDTVCVGQTFEVSNFSDSTKYSRYRFERRIDDGLYTFIDSTDRLNTAPFSTKFDSIGKYSVILFPTDFVSTIPLSARCAMQDTVLITALKPKADFSIDTAQAPRFVFTNLSVAADHYEWVIYNKDGSEREKKNVNPPADINWEQNLREDKDTFEVCLTAYTTIPKGGADICPDKVCKTIKNIFTTKITIPNVFTPNGDNHNDFFKIDVEGELKYDLMIFNRWGTKVFVSDDKNNMWNGKDYNDGSDCASGTYFFVFTYKLKAQEEKTVHGTITLIRP